MTEARPTLHIRSAQDLFEALDSGDEGIRLSVLQMISRHPAEAQAYGPWKGVDLLTRLMADARRESSTLVRGVIVKVVACFKGHRVLTFLQEEVRMSNDVDLVLELEPRLGAEPLSEMRDYLASLLDDPLRWRAQALVAARLLSRDETLSDMQRLRVALVTDAEARPPALDDATEEAWIAELNGPLCERARALAAKQGDAMLRLCKRWDLLSDATRKWLLGWIQRTHPDIAKAAVVTVLQCPISPDVARTVLQTAAALGVDADAFPAERADELLAHADPRVRAAALTAGCGDSELLAAWLADPSQHADVRLAAVRRLGAEGGEGGVDRCIALLGDADWHVRAAAAEALVRVGESVVERVQPLVLDGPPPVRVAAARILVELGREEWLEQTLAGAGQE